MNLDTFKSTRSQENDIHFPYIKLLTLDFSDLAIDLYDEAIDIAAYYADK